MNKLKIINASRGVIHQYENVKNTAVFGLPLYPRIYLQHSGDEQT
jgi:hypothetical protein